MSCWYKALAILPGVLETLLCLIYSPQMYAISLMDSTGIRDCWKEKYPRVHDPAGELGAMTGASIYASGIELLGTMHVTLINSRPRVSAQAACRHQFRDLYHDASTFFLCVI